MTRPVADGALAARPSTALARILGLAAALALAPCGPPAAAEVCAPYVEEHPAWTTASFRPHRSAFEVCRVSEERYREVIRDWLAGRPADATPLTSVSLGRAEAFPWLSRYLADTALQRPEWVRRIARASSGEHNRFVGAILAEPAFLQRLDAPFRGTPYAVVGVTVEKVLIGKAGEHGSTAAAADTPVPFDAQVWLRLAPRR